MLLDIQNLFISAPDKEIVHGLSLQIKAGEVHAIMGPNGSGKSTLSATLMGHPKYKVTKGKVKLNDKDLLKMDPSARAAAGLFLAFQYPKEIPGVNLVSFLRASYNAVNKARNKKFKPVPLYNFKKLLQEKMDLVGLGRAFMNRNVNEGFSGGEKKKAEILQMALLEPKLAILDETDSGLDIDALRTICEAILSAKKPEQSLLMVTHYERMLKDLKPDHVHIMMDGKIVLSGGKELAAKLEEEGYDYVRKILNEKNPLKIVK
ncbi:Fe-S cluster assembly ATPase SufC [Candidatus Peregrinibacteria bacterium]|nr:MAG: Fe-S cluster assembly ATPase SufC [Candidatus Peregrinibacteria bacterium]